MNISFPVPKVPLRRSARLLVVLCLFGLLSGCASTVIGTAADAAIAVAKTPFKVGGAVVDVVSDD